MKKLKIGKVKGIAIYLHWTFLVLLVGIFALYLMQGKSVVAALIGVGPVLLVFGCVVLHELGHALTALRYGVPTRDITLYPIGGVARLERIPEEPMKEFWIALAGPFVNMVIAAGLAVVLLVLGGSLSPVVLFEPEKGTLPELLLWINVALFSFNLLPAFPMDGGRILRAVLALRMSYTRASQIAASVGQLMAFFLGIAGFFMMNPFLIFIALFVYFGAQQESQQALIRAMTRGIPVRQVMQTRFTTLHPTDTLGTAVEALLAGSDQDFPIVEQDRVWGLLTRKQILQGLAKSGQEAQILDLLAPGCPAIEDGAMLEDAFETMNAAQCTTVPVVRNNRLVGLLTLENIGELMMISTALGQAGKANQVKSVLALHETGISST